MIQAKTRTIFDSKAVQKAVAKGNPESFRRAGAYTRGIAQRLLGSRKKKPNPAGLPPRSPTGRLRRAILFALERAGKVEAGVVTGPRASWAGQIGHTHEFGGTEGPTGRPAKDKWRLEPGGYGPIAEQNGKPVIAILRTDTQVDRAKQLAARLPHRTKGKPRRVYPARPFMAPTLALAQEHLPSLWRNSIKGA